MKKTSNKIGLIGAGAVGTSFLYAAMNQGIAADYVLIDTCDQIANGNALDLADTQAVLPTPFTNIRVGDYVDLIDTDLLVITAGKTRRLEQTRLDIMVENAVIMHNIGMKVKASGFDGITLIASNPVDVLTLVYQEATGFNPQKVIGSSTNLDSARLRRILGDKLNINPISINAYLLGEHGDSAVAIWSQASILGQPLDQYLIDQNTNIDLQVLRNEAMGRGSKIIGLKQATFYGIGASLTQIAKAVLTDAKAVLVIGTKPNGEYQTEKVYIGLPTIVGKSGCEKILEWKLNFHEQALLNQSVKILKESINKAQEAIQLKLFRL